MDRLRDRDFPMFQPQQRLHPIGLDLLPFLRQPLHFHFGGADLGDDACDGAKWAECLRYPRNIITKDHMSVYFASKFPTHGEYGSDVVATVRRVQELAIP